MTRLHPFLPFGAALLALAAYLTAPVSDPRIFFHLAVGDTIRARGLVPSLDAWTVIGAGKPWIAESWSFDVLLSWLEGVFGMKTFGVLGLVVTSAFVLSVGQLLAFLSGAASLGFLVTVLVVCGSLERAELSPELCGWTLLLLAATLCFRPIRRGMRLLALAVTAVLFANLGPTYLLLPVFVLFLFPGSAGERVLAMAVVLLASLVGPYHGEEALQMLSSVWQEARLSVLFQDSAANVFLFNFDFLLLLWLVFALVLPPRRVFSDQRLLLLSGVLSLGGLIHRDLLSPALMATGMLVASTLRFWLEPQDGTPARPQLVEAFFRLSQGITRLPPAGGLWLALCVFFVNAQSAVRTPLVDFFLPRVAVDFLLEEHLSGVILAERAIGPYLDYRFYRLPEPKLRPAYDERLPLFSPELAVSERALKNLQQGWNKLFSAFSPDIVICRKGSPLFSYLDASAEWKLGYEDEAAIYSAEDIENPAGPKKKKSEFAWVVFLKIAAKPAA